MKILIIDDNPADRNFYKKHIEESQLFDKVAIEECDSLSKAFKLFEKDRFKPQNLFHGQKVKMGEIIGRF
jgi:hypothetical protein